MWAWPVALRTGTKRRPIGATGLIVLTTMLALGAPTVARADVLIEELPSHIACGDDIRFGVWYQSFSGGPKWAKLIVKSINGKTIGHKRVTATTTWRHYSYTPRCGRTYFAEYRTPGGLSKYRIHVSS